MCRDGRRAGVNLPRSVIGLFGVVDGDDFPPSIVMFALPGRRPSEEEAVSR